MMLNSSIFPKKNQHSMPVGLLTLSKVVGAIGVALCSMQTNAYVEVPQSKVTRNNISKVSSSAGATETVNRTIHSNKPTQDNDAIKRLIEQSEKDQVYRSLTIRQSSRIKPMGASDIDTQPNYALTHSDFTQWLNVSPYRIQQVAKYQNYLSRYVGAENVPPMNQMLTSARSWRRCGYEPYQIPPRELWSNMVLTLKLFSHLKAQGVLPPNTEIRSVYRSPGLNACAGGAAASKHLTNGAIDVWIPDKQDNHWYIDAMQDNLCQFWAAQGASYRFGLGIYATGAIHLDTQRYRIWGTTNTSYDSPCRYVD